MDRPANDITTEARVVQEVYLIDPTTKKPTGPGGASSISAAATAAAPSYDEGESAPLSMDLAGNLRIGGTISAETATTATAAAPTYIEASADNALSVNLTGDLRTIAKQSGSWTVAATQSGTWNVTNISGTVSLPTGASTAANQTAITGSKAAGTAATSSILTGGVFNTSLPTLTNGQQAAAQMDASGRVYVNVGTMAALPAGTNNIGDVDVATLPALVAGSAVIGKVGLSSGGNDVDLADPTTGTGTQVPSSATAVTILAANTARKGATIFNDSTQVLYLILSNTTPTSAVYTVKMVAASYYEVPAGYNGIIKGIWASANGNAVVTELT